LKKIALTSGMKSTEEIFKGIDFRFVGGVVRDAILKKQSKDIDVVVFIPIEQVSSILKKKPVIVNERFKTARYIYPKFNVDVNYCNSSFDDDLKRRDFTVNSISCFQNGVIYDPLCGAEDLKKKVLKCYDMNNFKDDPLRIIRAVRFSYKLNLKMQKGMKSYIEKEHKSLSKISKERILTEFQAIFAEGSAGKVMSALNSLGILISIFPELRSTEKFLHVKSGSRFLIKHLTRTVEAVDSVLSLKLPQSMKRYAAENMLVLYLAALLHDIEKPAAFKMDGKKQRFNNHDIMSSKTASLMLRRELKMSNSDISKVSSLIAMHMRPHFLIYGDATNRGLYRLSKDAGADLDGLFILSMADALSSDGELKTEYLLLYKRIKHFEKEMSKKKISFISGNDVMDYFKICSSPKVGDLIKIGNEYAVSNNITDKKIILEFLKSIDNR